MVILRLRARNFEVNNLFADHKMAFAALVSFFPLIILPRYLKSFTYSKVLSLTCIVLPRRCLHECSVSEYEFFFPNKMNYFLPIRRLP